MVSKSQVQLALSPLRRLVLELDAEVGRSVSWRETRRGREIGEKSESSKHRGLTEVRVRFGSPATHREGRLGG